MSTTDIAGASASTAARPKSPRRKAVGEHLPVSRGLESRSPLAPPDLADRPDLAGIVTEDDRPVDNVFSEKQQRLLTEPLYTSWAGPGEGRSFLAMANVGLFHAVNQPPLVPDMMLSLDVATPDEVWSKAHRSYFIWVYGKPPDVVVEIVSNAEGGEEDRKLALYARIGIPYYVILDPERHLSGEVLRLFRLEGGVYRRTVDGRLPSVGLRLGLWTGQYEQLSGSWLRWSDAAGALILTGAERAMAAEALAADLAARLSALGIDPQDAGTAAPMSSSGTPSTGS